MSIFNSRSGFAAFKPVAAFLFLVSVLSGCGESQNASAPQEVPAAVEEETDFDPNKAPDADWLSHGRTYSEKRFTPLAQIDAGNVADLGLAWYADLASPGEIESTPLIADGIIYTTGTFGVVYAIDGRSGEQLWRYDPGAQMRGEKFATWGRNRGVAMWRDKIYVGAADGRLIALDAKSGDPVWSVQTFDPSQPYSITGAPRVFDGRVVIGQGGGDKATRGFASAYDAESGELLWRFWIVPGDPSKGFESKAMEMAAETWNGEWWKYGGGGNPWNAFAYDPELGLIYIGTGNGGPWGRNARSPGGGDNLFISSIVAVKADTGEYVWHYQTTPGDQWDYTATQDMILATLPINGEERRVIMQAPKNGFFYVLDRETGEFLSAEPYVPVTWASHIDPETGRPVEHPRARGGDGFFDLSPSWLGGHSWQPMSFNPDLDYAFIPFIEASMKYDETPVGEWEFDPNAGMDTSVRIGLPENMKGGILAWDAVNQREVWRHHAPDGVAGGTMTTAGGLVFQGTGDGYLVAYDAKSGEELWRGEAGNGVIGGPASYEIDGEQYVVVTSGIGGAYVNMAAFDAQEFGWKYGEGRRVLAFKLNGDASLPERADPPAPEASPPDPMKLTGDELYDRGSLIYHTYCVECHGPSAVGAGGYPDLRRTQMLDSLELVVREGALVPNGMPNFADRISPEDLEALRAYLRERSLLEE
ncbi:PQQ-dependent dehydrogenase, methanol/ethanol family [Hyphococcus luteus]|uniref:PQQ-dependent dehydrogenase, methanol/ethanol family n=1 Tax=Hyphococcus luteus TaxID=2058213 RepID=A0A2S7K566_9PROT|nr:PQQ-dependent dehydrogenase, methanol/ethanol family [Marinicaulis flavus]PQA87657.1 PQQ-dependent dehydrogenase, methanol/ethanol family [Marinicaulis flavus]